MTARKNMFVVGALVSLACVALPALAQDAAGTAAQKKNPRHGDPYMLDVCPVSKEKLGSMGDPIVKVHKGRELRFCCKGCIKEYKNDPEAVIAAADKLIIERQMHYYPIKTCIVSGEPLEKTVDVVYMNRLVRLCCKGCKKEFNGDPKAIIAKLDKMVMKHQDEHYPLTTCPVSDESIDGDAVKVVHGNRLFKFCCKRCARGFQKNPTASVAKLDKAWAAKHAEGAHGHGHGEHGEHGHSHDKDGGHGSAVGGG